MRDGSISALVIEDEADIRQLLRALLEREGYEVAEAFEGRDGVRQFHQSQPDIVILDVGLPDLDGWQVLERIRDMSDVPGAHAHGARDRARQGPRPQFRCRRLSDEAIQPE